MKVKLSEQYTQLLHADDSGYGGKICICTVRKWLCFDKAWSKVWILSRAVQEHEKAKEKFGDLGMNFVEVHKFLGGYIGKETEVRKLITEKVKKCIEAVEDLAEAAVRYPQDAYVAFIKSLQTEWGYVQRTVSNDGDEFKVLDQVIQNKFLPAVFGRQLSEW